MRGKYGGLDRAVQEHKRKTSTMGHSAFERKEKTAENPSALFLDIIVPDWTVKNLSHRVQSGSSRESLSFEHAFHCACEDGSKGDTAAHCDHPVGW